MGIAQTIPIPGILLLYDHVIYPDKNAPTIMEHVNSFRLHSRFKVWAVNTRLGFPGGLSALRFQVIVLHYSLFGSHDYRLNARFLRYFERDQSSYKIAFYQDEYYFCKQRFAFLNRFKINCVYSLLAPEYYKDVYQKYTKVPLLLHTLTGYVNDDLIKKATQFAKPDYARTIDVGYRGRQLPFYMGKGAQEKYQIAVCFRRHASDLGLKMDLETREGERLYGDAWYRFLGNCKAFLGVEAGVSIFDTEDIVRTEYERLIAEKPEMTFEEMSERILNCYEDNIHYRTISPRHFEAAAFRICQILYEGNYQGIMKPMVHYIPLKKDFSNFSEVISLFRNDQFRRQITENCYRDLIASEKYSYRNFIKSFDNELLEAGFTPQTRWSNTHLVSATLSWDLPVRMVLRILLNLFYLFLANPRMEPLLKYLISVKRLLKRH